MANKPKYFDIEDSVTGKVYRVETDAEDATYDEAASYLESLPETEWAQYEYNPTPQQAPAAPVRSGSVVVSTPQQTRKPVAVDAKDYQLGMDTFGDLSPEVNTLSSADQKVFLGLANDPNISEDQLNQFLVARGIQAMTPEQMATSAAERKKIFAGETLPYGRVVQDNLFEGIPLPADVTSYQEKGGDGFFDQIGRSAASAWADPASLMNYLDRTKTDFFDVYADEIAKQFPDATPEELDALEEQYIGYIARRRSEAAEAGVADDNFVPWLIGQFIAVEPYDVIPIGRAAKAGTKIGRAAEKAVEGAAVGAVGDVVGQGLAISDQAQDEFDPVRTLASAGLSGVISGGVQGAGDALSEVASRSATNAKEPAAGIVVPTGDRRSKAYKQQITEAVSATQAHVDTLTEGWTNKPNIAVYNNFTKLSGINNRALGVFLSDGSVALNLERIGKKAAKEGVSVEEMTNSVIFHESLGHFALDQEYGARLDDMLDTFYTNGNTRFQQLVNEWMDDHPKQYADGDPRGVIQDPETYRRIRATEEVMAKWAEDDGVIPKKYIDTFINMVKDFLRRMNWGGYQPSYSAREVKSLLAVAQQKVLKGEATGESGQGSARYMYIGRQELEDNYYDDQAEGRAAPWNERLRNDLLRTEDAYVREMEEADPSQRETVKAKYSAEGQSRLDTGWFRGADGKWRFEISDENADLLNLPEPGKTLPLRSVLYHPDLFALYRELGEDIRVTTKVLKPHQLGSFNSETNVLTLNSQYRDALMRGAPEDQDSIVRALETTLHEVQHAIQEIEDFARGGGPNMALRNLPDRVLYKGAYNFANYIREVESVQVATLLDAVDTLKEMPEYRAYIREEVVTRRLYQKLEDARDKYRRNGKRLPWEEEKNIPEIVELKKLWNESSKRESDTRWELHKKLGLPKYILKSEGLTSKAIRFYNEMMWLANDDRVYDSYESSYKNLESKAQKVEQLANTNNKAALIQELSQDDNVKFDAYEHLFGEVEARDVEARRTLTDEGRRTFAPYSLTGIKPENYAVTFDGLGPANSQAKPAEGQPIGGVNKILDDNRYMMDDDDEDGIAPLTSADLFEIQSAQDILLQLSEGHVPQVRRWAESKRTANLGKGLTASQIRKLKRVGELDVRLYQYENLALALSDKVTQLYYKMQTGGATPQVKAAYLETMYKFKELTGHIFQDQAEIARALNFMKQLSLTKRKLKDINELLSEYDKSGVGAFESDDLFKQFAEQVQYMLASGNPMGAANMIKKVEEPYWWQYVLSIRHASMLSGLGTHAKNAYDGLMVIAREMEETLMALPGFYARKGLQGMGYDVKDGVSPQEAAARAYGLLRAALDLQTYIQTWQAFKTGHQSRSYSAKIEMTDARIGMFSKINDALYASDIFFRTFHNNANLYSLGVRKAREDGFTGVRAFEEGTANAMNPTKEMLKQARQLTDTALLVDSPSGLTNWVESGKSIRPNMDWGRQTVSFVLNMLLPFLRVTDRLLFQAIRRSPLSFLDKNTRAEWVEGGASADIAVARTLYGTALLAYYWQQAGTGDDEEGDIEGEGPVNYKKLQSLEATGYRPNSQVEGNKMVDITALNLSLNPFGTDNNIAAQVASIREAWERGAKGETEAEQIAGGIGQTLRAMLGVLASQSYAENMSTYLAPVLEKDPARQESIDSAAVGGMASQFVPAAVRQANQMLFDKERKVTRGDGSFGDRVYGRIVSGIPGLSENLPDRVDALGDTMPQGRTTFGIGNYTEIKQDPVSQEIRKLDRETKDPILSNAPSSFQLEGYTVRLTAEQQQVWNTASGQFIKEFMSLAVANPTWKTLDTATKVQFMQELKQEAYDAGKVEALKLIDPNVQIEEDEL